MRNNLALLLLTIATNAFCQTQLGSSQIWHSNNNVVLGSDGSLLQPYPSYTSQNNRILEIKGNDTSYGMPGLAFVKNSGFSDYGGSIFWLSSSFSTDKRYIQISGNVTNGKGNLVFNARNSTDPQGVFRSMTFNSDGNLGIGKSPLYRLDVDGTINASDILINGQPISNSSSLWNENASDINYSTGNVGIGTSDTKGYRLAIAGKTITEEVKVALVANWPDFVFKSYHKLRTLEEVEEHIIENGHLPEIPSEAEVTENGINLGEMDTKLLQKIEELTLYMIDMNKRMKQIETENTELKAKVQSLENK